MILSMVIFSLSIEIYSGEQFSHWATPLNNLFLIHGNANFLTPSGCILCIIFEYLISDEGCILCIVYLKKILLLWHYSEYTI